MGSWNWERASELLPLMLEGLRILLFVTAVASVIALGLGLVVAIVNRSAPRAVTMPLFAVMEFIRNTPVLVQAVFVWTLMLMISGTSASAMWTGALVLGVHYASYTAEAYRAGIDGIPKGQWEAITALSLPKPRAWFAVLLPQALRKSTPALGNYVIALFKEVPILSAIGVAEMVTQVKGYAGIHYGGSLEGFTIAGLIFLVISYPVALLMRKLEKRLAN
ncbi:polar amino acid transport system permease protein [Stackebrandtia endophytica]|uniref:Polar amino acid transport system permease protein n=1 Tax=Stackebrandtia endophytica TaxID=1496996 RepID=A0A543ASY8_9ACTN|nr:ABC transporter permease subunit [Stackebrandtia endophytica]TQL75701.1 polar amino acid transport system permease protein [Stackebrandtia endophytica]